MNLHMSQLDLISPQFNTALQTVFNAGFTKPKPGRSTVVSPKSHTSVPLQGHMRPIWFIISLATCNLLRPQNSEPWPSQVGSVKGLQEFLHQIPA